MSQPRRRGVALSEEGLQIFSAALDERITSQGMRPSRAMRAEVLGVSEGTVRKILNCDTVDLSTMQLAFASLRLNFDSELFASNDRPQEEEEPPDDLDEKPIHRRMAWLGGAGALVISILFFLPVWGGHIDEEKQPTDWRLEISPIFDAGREQFHQGRYDEAQATFIAAEKMSREIKSSGYLAESFRMQADIALVKGDLEKAWDLYNEALRLRVQRKETPSYPALHEAIGVVEVKQQKFEAAKQSFRKALGGFAESQDRMGAAMVQRNLGSLCAELGEYDLALSWFSAARSSILDNADHEILVDVRAREAMVLHKLGHDEEPMTVLSECLGFWQKRQHPHWIARTQLQIGIAHFGHGRHQQAYDSLVKSHQGFLAVGDSIGAKDAEAWLTKASS